MIGAAAQQILDRVAHIDALAPRNDAYEVEQALHRHFASLGLKMLPVRWFDSQLDGYAEAVEPGRNSDWLRAAKAVRRAAKNVATATMRGNRGPDKFVAWKVAQNIAASGIWESGRPARQASDAAYRAAKRRFGTLMPLGTLMHHAMDQVAEAVGFVNALTVLDDLAGRTLAEVWSLWIDAYAHGLLLYAIRERTIDCVARPRLAIVGDQLHREDGPAVEWAGGDRYWFWRGVEVPREVIEDPERITPAAVLEESNQEVRRIMIERMGAERLLYATRAELIAADSHGKLWHCQLDGLHAVVEVENGTAESDGRRRRYFLRVPPDIGTARHAVAWTYGMASSEYEVMVRT
jgi:hypothetical protein